MTYSSNSLDNHLRPFIGADDCFASLKRFSIGRRLGVVALTAFSLSLCIELLQLVLKVGYFEVMDLVLNTLGGFVGALMSVGVRKVVGERRH